MTRSVSRVGDVTRQVGDKNEERVEEKPPAFEVGCTGPSVQPCEIHRVVLSSPHPHRQSTSTYQLGSDKHGKTALRVQSSHAPKMSRDTVCIASCQGASSISLPVRKALSFATRLIASSSGCCSNDLVLHDRRTARDWSSLRNRMTFERSAVYASYTSQTIERKPAPTSHQPTCAERAEKRRNHDDIPGNHVAAIIYQLPLLPSL